MIYLGVNYSLVNIFDKQLCAHILSIDLIPSMV